MKFEQNSFLSMSMKTFLLSKLTYLSWNENTLLQVILQLLLGPAAAKNYGHVSWRMRKWWSVIRLLTNFVTTLNLITKFLSQSRPLRVYGIDQAENQAAGQLLLLSIWRSFNHISPLAVKIFCCCWGPPLAMENPHFWWSDPSIGSLMTA